MPVVHEPFGKAIGDGGERQGGSETLDIPAWAEGDTLDDGRLTAEPHNLMSRRPLPEPPLPSTR